MIKSKHLNQDIKELEEKIKKGTASNSDLVKAVLLVAKLVRDVRTNQTRIMKAQGVELIKPDDNRVEDVEKKETEE